MTELQAGVTMLSPHELRAASGSNRRLALTVARKEEASHVPTAACRPPLFEDGHERGLAVTGPIRHRMPDGAQIVSELGSTVTMRITMPADDAGHFGRQCPSCKRMFRMHAEDCKALPDDLQLTCPYCCLRDGHSEFMPDQQMQRTLAAAGEYAQQLVAGKLDEIFGGMTQSVNARGGAIRMSY
jgi:hypothetical protein